MTYTLAPGTNTALLSENALRWIAKNASATLLRADARPAEIARAASAKRRVEAEQIRRAWARGEAEYTARTGRAPDPVMRAQALASLEDR